MKLLKSTLWLSEIQTSIHNVYQDLQTRENNANAERGKNIFFCIDVKHQTVLELFQCHNDNIAKLVGISKSKETLQTYEVARKRMTDFIKEYYNVSDISPKEVIICSYGILKFIWWPPVIARKIPLQNSCNVFALLLHG